MSAEGKRPLKGVSDAILIAEVCNRQLDVEDIFPDHECEENCDHLSNIEPSDFLADHHQISSGGALFGIQIAYEHIFTGQTEKAAQALCEAVPALKKPSQQKRLLTVSDA